MKTLYTGHATCTAGREGTAETDDKRLSLKIARPGSSAGTNPEQLFACAYGACFGGAVEAVAKKMQASTTGPAQVQADVSLNQDDQGGFFISAVLNVSIPGVEGKTAREIVEAAHQMCPYSKATRGNIDVTLKVDGQELAKAA